MQALAKIAVRSGEPYRLQCYSILAAACGAGGGGAAADALGVQSATRPALALLDKMYAAQAVLEQLWAEHGEDVEGWPKEVVASLGRRNAELARQVSSAQLRGLFWHRMVVLVSCPIPPDAACCWPPSLTLLLPQPLLLLPSSLPHPTPPTCTHSPAPHPAG